MGQLLHKCARTTEKTRREIQLSKQSIASLARRFGVNRKTIAKWKNRTSCQDVPMGPKVKRSKVLTEQEEKVVIAFRKLTGLPLETRYTLYKKLYLTYRVLLCIAAFSDTAALS